MTRTRRSGFLIAVRRRYIKLRRHRRLLTIKKSVIEDHRPTEAGRVRRFRRWNVLLGLRSALPDGIAKELGLPGWPLPQYPAKLPPGEATASLQHYGPKRPPLLKPQGTNHRQKLTVRAPQPRRALQTWGAPTGRVSETSQKWTSTSKRKFGNP